MRGRRGWKNEREMGCEGFEGRGNTEINLKWEIRKWKGKFKDLRRTEGN